MRPALGFIWLLSRRPYRLQRRDLFNVFVAALVGLVMPLVVLAYCVVQGHGHSYFGMLLRPGATGHDFCVRADARRLADASPVGRRAGRPGLPRALGSGRQPTRHVAGPRRLRAGCAVGLRRRQHVHQMEAFAHSDRAADGALDGNGNGHPVAVGVSAFFGRTNPTGAASGRADWPMAIEALAFLGIVGTGIGIWLFNGLIIGQGPLIASMVTYVFPLVALGWGIYDGDPPTARQIAAMAGVLSMVALVQFGTAAPIGDASHAAVNTPEFCPATAAGALLESAGEPE